MKTFFKLLLLFTLIGYLGFAFVHFSQRRNTTVCRRVNMSITDSTSANFITRDDVHAMLQRAGVYPVGKMMDSISSQHIEEVLRRDGFVKNVICYKTPGGAINLLISQRLPLLRIMADNGDDYYIDAQGVAMTPRGYEADLVVATGCIDRKFAASALVGIGRYLRFDVFWDSQIEQIHVNPDHTIEVVTRVGGHIIQMGKPEKMDVKFRNLRAFYEKVLPTVGWNRYASISVAYENQIICKK